MILNKADRTFHSQIKYGDVSDPSSMSVGDFNNDSKLDLIVTGNDNVAIFF